jgi:hypothetical protein
MIELLRGWEHRVKIIPETGCWIWLGAKQKNGYGKLSIRYSRDLVCHHVAHKYFYEKKYGKVPPGLQLDHIICDTKICCNPDHVKPVTQWENTRRSLTNPWALQWRRKYVPPS